MDNDIMVSHNGAKPVPYKHVIEPVSHKGKFLPNLKVLKDIRKDSTIYIQDHVFDKVQREGKTIIVNHAGGWCYLSEDSKVVTD